MGLTLLDWQYRNYYLKKVAVTLSPKGVIEPVNSHGSGLVMCMQTSGFNFDLKVQGPTQKFGLGKRQ